MALTFSIDNMNLQEGSSWFSINRLLKTKGWQNIGFGSRASCCLNARKSGKPSRIRLPRIRVIRDTMKTGLWDLCLTLPPQDKLIEKQFNTPGINIAHHYIQEPGKSGRSGMGGAGTDTSLHHVWEWCLVGVGKYDTY